MKHAVKRMMVILAACGVLAGGFLACQNDVESLAAYYTVSFNSDGGSFVAAQSVQSGKTAVEPKSPTKEAYTFEGWRKDGAAFDFATPITADTTLIAAWQEVKPETPAAEEGATESLDDTPADTTPSDESKSDDNGDTTGSGDNTDSGNTAGTGDNGNDDTGNDDNSVLITESDTEETIYQKIQGMTTSGMVKATGYIGSKLEYIVTAVKKYHADDEVYIDLDIGDITRWGSFPSQYARSFFYCDKYTSIVLPKQDFIVIGDNACFGLKKLQSVTIPNNVTIIGANAFYGCSGLTNITIPNSVTTIKNSAFYGCSELTNITIPNSVTSILWYAFCGCSKLTSIIIPDSVETIGTCAFMDDDSLQKVCFTKKEGWYVSKEPFPENGSKQSAIPIDKGTLDNEEVAATLLRETYVLYYWKRFDD